MGVLDDAIREHLELKLKHGANEDEVRRQEAEALGAVRREPAPERGQADAGAAPGEADAVEPEQAAFETSASEAEPHDDSQLLVGEEDETAFEEHIAPPAPADEAPIDEAPIVEREPDDYGAAREPGEEAVLAEGEAQRAAFAEGEPEEAGFAEGEPEEAVFAEDGREPEEAGFGQRDEAAAAEDTVLIERAEDEEAVVVEEEGEPALADERSARDVVSEPPLEEGLADEEAALEAERSAEALDAARPREAHEAGPDEADEDVLEETPDFLQETPEHDRLWFEQKPPRDFDFD